MKRKKGVYDVVYLIRFSTLKRVGMSEAFRVRMQDPVLMGFSTLKRVGMSEASPPYRVQPASPRFSTLKRVGMSEAVFRGMIDGTGNLFQYPQAGRYE